MREQRPARLGVRRYRSDSIVVMTKLLEGSRAQQILDHIANNPGTTKNAIITALDINPSVARKYTQLLIRRGLVVDEPDENGYHHYRVKEGT